MGNRRMKKKVFTNTAAIQINKNKNENHNKLILQDTFAKYDNMNFDDTIIIVPTIAYFLHPYKNSQFIIIKYWLIYWMEVNHTTSRVE